VLGIYSKTKQVMNQEPLTITDGVSEISYGTNICYKLTEETVEYVN
jgi:hypothetical protein